jgi:DNA polymerase III epsilon subunit-like protein
MNNIYFLDTETTSQDQTRARVVQMAIVAPSLSDDWLSIRAPHYECEWDILPPVDIDIGAMATHHLTPKKLANAPKFTDSEWFEVLMRRIKDDHILVAHNAPYDVSVLANEWVIVPHYIDTLRVAKHLLEDPGIDSFSLQYLRYFYSLDDAHEWELSGGFAHSALYDTIVLKWFYEFLLEEVKHTKPTVDPVEHMLVLTHSPILIRTFRFGKYNGRTIEDISVDNRGYLEWLLNSEMSKPEHERNADMIYTLNHWLTR